MQGVGDALLRVSCLLLAAGLLSFAAIHPARATSQQPGLGNAEAFDRAYRALTAPKGRIPATSTTDALVERLGRSLPAGDVAREVRYRSFRCEATPWEDYEAASRYAQETIRRARALGDMVAEARGRFCAAKFQQPSEPDGHDLAQLKAAVALAERAGDPYLLASMLSATGDLLSFRGELADAIRHFQRAGRLFTQAGISSEPIIVVYGMGVAYRRMGEFAIAAQYLDRTRAMLLADGDPAGATFVLVQKGYLAHDRGTPGEALQVFAQATAEAERHRVDAARNVALLGSVESLVKLGEGERALQMLERAGNGFAQLKDDSARDSMLLLRGQADALLGRHRQALEAFARAEPLIEASGNTRYLADVRLAQALSLEAIGSPAQALAHYKRHVTLDRQLRDDMQREQRRLLGFEYEMHRADIENQRLRHQADARQARLQASEQVRRLLWVAVSVGALLLVALVALAWQLARRSRQLQQLSLSDPLTGTPNRRAIEGNAARMLAEANRNGAPLSVLMLDLDHFKRINDSFGHAVGDRVLRDAASAWQLQLRSQDMLGRLGGEEFAVLCPGTPLEHAVAVGNRLREATALLRFADLDDLRVTVSIGAAQARRGTDTQETLLARADEALYRAKHAGRNRVDAAPAE